MSNRSWQDSLAQIVRQLRRENRETRIAIMGIGNEQHGDDAAGVMAAHQLQTASGRAVQPPSGDLESPWLIIDAGCAPENVTGPLRRFAPDLVLLIDAAQLDEPPGTVRWLHGTDTVGLSASTHTLPLHMLAHYVQCELECEVFLLAIQPADTSLDTPLSPAVRRAVDSIVHALAAFQFGGTCQSAAQTSEV